MCSLCTAAHHHSRSGATTGGEWPGGQGTAGTTCTHRPRRDLDGAQAHAAPPLTLQHARHIGQWAGAVGGARPGGHYHTAPTGTQGRDLAGWHAKLASAPPPRRRRRRRAPPHPTPPPWPPRARPLLTPPRTLATHPCSSPPPASLTGLQLLLVTGGWWWRWQRRQRRQQHAQTVLVALHSRLAAGEGGTPGVGGHGRARDGSTTRRAPGQPAGHGQGRLFEPALQPAASQAQLCGLEAGGACGTPNP